MYIIHHFNRGMSCRSHLLAVDITSREYTLHNFQRYFFRYLSVGYVTRAFSRFRTAIRFTMPYHTQHKIL